MVSTLARNRLPLHVIRSERRTIARIACRVELLTLVASRHSCPFGPSPKQKSGRAATFGLSEGFRTQGKPRVQVRPLQGHLLERCLSLKLRMI